MDRGGTLLLGARGKLDRGGLEYREGERKKRREGGREVLLLVMKSAHKLLCNAHHFPSK